MPKDLFSYTSTKAQFATDKNLKKQNFKEAIDQIEAALRGEDPAPTEVMQFIRTSKRMPFLTIYHIAATE